MILSFFSILSIFFGSDSLFEAKVKDQPDPCRIYGRVFIEENPRYAHYKVYEDDSEAFSDIIIFEEENALYADEVGHWTFVEKREFADVYIYFEENRNLADFSVFYTEYASFAGCNR